MSDVSVSSRLYQEDANRLASVIRQGTVWLNEWTVASEEEARTLFETLYQIDPEVLQELSTSCLPPRDQQTWVFPVHTGLCAMGLKQLKHDVRCGVFRALCKRFPLTLCHTFPGIQHEDLSRVYWWGSQS